MNRDGELYPLTQSPALQPSTSGPGDEAHYGQVGKVPWTFAQTLLGAGVTIVPWMLLVVLSAVATTNTSTNATRRLAPAVDILGGISFLLFTALVEGAFLLAPLIIAMRTRAPGTSRSAALRALGLRATRFWPAVAWVAGGMLVVLVVTIIYGAIIQLFHLPLETNGETLAIEAETMPFTVIGALIGAVFIAPFCEEIFFRGFLFGGLLRGMSVAWAIVVSTLLFTISHGDVGSAVPLFAIGIMLAVIRWRTGSIWPSMALHMLNNALAAVLVVGTILSTVAR